MIERPDVARLYAIADAATLAPLSVSEAVEKLVASGVRWIQVRGKGLPDEKLMLQAQLCAATAEASGARLWVNDRPDIASLVGAFGVHLGQDDLAPCDAREFLGDDVVIGLSTHDRAQVEHAASDPCVDVIAVGPVFATASKPDHKPIVGKELITWARSRTSKPLVAIGGIDSSNVAAVLAAGADSVAVLGALCRGDLESNARALLRAVLA